MPSAMGSTRQKCLCRVPGPGGTRQNLFSENKKKFAECHPECPRMSLGKVFKKKIKTNFAECLMAGTRQNLTVGDRRHGPAKFCRAPGFAECKILPSATLGKILLCRVPRYFALGKVSDTRQSTVFQ